MYESTMPFGKWKGTPLSEIPEDYLQWALREATSMDAWLRGEVEEEIDRRRKERTKGQTRFDDDYNWNWHGGESGSRTRGGAGSGSSGYASATRVPSTVDRQTALDIVDAGRRALARKNHPDVGGSNAAMSKINTVCDWLEEHLKNVLPPGNGSSGQR